MRKSPSDKQERHSTPATYRAGCCMFWLLRIVWGLLPDNYTLSNPRLCSLQSLNMYFRQAQLMAYQQAESISHLQTKKAYPLLFRKDLSLL